MERNHLVNTVLPRAAIVTVGDELLLGRTIDTNAAWLAAALNRIGLAVGRAYTVGDDAEAIAGAVLEGIESHEVVVVTGGLGPTPDDLTRDAVAGVLGVRLIALPEWRSALEERFRLRGYAELPPSNEGQALAPEEGDWIPNPVGTAPGLVFSPEGAHVVLLPGIPREMRALFDSGVRPRLVDWFGSRLSPLHERVLRTTGIPESVLVERLEEGGMEVPEGVGVAFLPGLEGVDIRLTVRAASEAEVGGLLDAAEGALGDMLGGALYAHGEEDLTERVLEAMREHGLLLAVAESCTGGLVLERLTGVAGASDVVLGGVVAYANSVKRTSLGVDAELLEAEGAVSEGVARAMAEGVRSRLGADFGIGITGIAGPGGGGPEKPVGTVHYAVAGPGWALGRAACFPGDREAVRRRAAQAALALLLESLGAPRP